MTTTSTLTSPTSNFNMNNFNDLINQANKLISCGPSCQKEKQSELLKQKYLEAQYNVTHAPEELSEATKNYIIYTQGDSEYNDYLDKDLEKKADAIISMYKTNLTSDINNIQTNLTTYKGLQINYDNIIDLYKKYKNENDSLEKKLKGKTSDIITNDRKTFYKDQTIDQLNGYYYFLFFVYVLVVIVYFLSIFLVNSNVNLSIRILVLILMIMYPFILNIIVP
jgi:hypothetical protein